MSVQCYSPGPEGLEVRPVHLWGRDGYCCLCGECKCDESGHEWRYARCAEIRGEYICEVKCRHCGKTELL